MSSPLRHIKYPNPNLVVGIFISYALLREKYIKPKKRYYYEPR